jgi:hypothetical protein
MSDASPVQDSGIDSGPVLVPQPHGGALLSGGKPGNKGGYSLSNDWTRRLKDLGIRKGIPRIESALDGESDNTALKAVELIGKFAFGEAKLILADEMLEAVATACVEFMPDREVREKFLARLEELLKDLA